MVLKQPSLCLLSRTASETFALLLICILQLSEVPVIHRFRTKNPRSFVCSAYDLAYHTVPIFLLLAGKSGEQLDCHVLGYGYALYI